MPQACASKKNSLLDQLSVYDCVVHFPALWADEILGTSKSIVREDSEVLVVKAIVPQDLGNHHSFIALARTGLGRG
jgi:hypothetical protein